MNEEVTSKWWKDLCDGPSLAISAKERGFETNNELKIHYRYLEQWEKERKLSDVEKVVR